MKKRLLLISTLMIAPVYADSVSDVSPYLQQSRETVKALGASLKQTLVSTMKKDGPEKAIAVCNTDAAPLTNQVSLENGVSISRTSTRFRNAQNAPDDWEKQVLDQFQERKVKGESLKTMEYGELITTNGKVQFRYMKAIPMGEPCLACHGNAIAPNIQRKISTLYPHDKATDFKVGDLRGAFSVVVIIE